MFRLMTESIRLDEAQSIWMFTKSFPTLFHLVGSDVHVPLYGILLHIWMQVFGTDIITVRMFSFLFFILSIPLVYIVTKRLYRDFARENIAFYTMLVFMLSPFLLWYASEARMYTLLIFFALISHYYFLDFLHSYGKKGKLGFFLVSLFGFYTHYFYFLLTAAQGLFIIGTLLFSQKEQIKKNKVTEFITFASIIFCDLLLFTPWIVYVVSLGEVQNAAPLIPPPTSYNIFQTFILFVFGFQNQIIQSAIVSLWPLFVIVLFFIFTRRFLRVSQNLVYAIITSTLPIALTFILSYIHPIFLTRYLIFVTPLLFSLIVWLVVIFSKRKSQFGILLLLSIMALSLVFQTNAASTPVKEHYENTAEYLEVHATPSDIIAVSAPFTIYPLEYSYHGTARIVTIPFWNRFTYGPIPSYSDTELEKEINTYKLVYDRLFLVLSYNQGYQQNIQQYLDTHYQLLEIKDFSETIQLRVYKLRY